jgi:hypothetical protein
MLSQRTKARFGEVSMTDTKVPATNVTEAITLLRSVRDQPSPPDTTAVSEGSTATEVAAAERVSSACGWPSLLGPQQHARPPFPLHVFPEWLREYVEDVAETFQVAVDTPAVFALGLIGAAAAKRVRVSKSSDGHDCHPTNIWVMPVLGSGDGKTPVLVSMKKSFQDVQDDLRERAVLQTRARKVRRDVLGRRYSSLVQRCAKASDPVVEAELQEQIHAARAELDALREDSGPRLIGEDMTIEALVQRMAENDGALLLASDEGSRFFANAARSSPGGVSNIEAPLKAHSAATLHFDRVSRPSLMVQEPTLSLVLATQTKTLGKLLGNETFAGRGLWERFLVVVPDSMVGARVGSPPPINRWVNDSFHGKVRELLALPRFQKHLTDPMTPELRIWSAWSILGDFLQAIDRRMGPGGDLSREPILGWAGKLRTNVIRLAGILWLAENSVPADGRRFDVSTGHVERAFDLAFYFLAHAQVVFARERSALDGDVETVLAFLRGRAAFHAREVQNRFGSRFPKRHLLQPVLDALVARHAIRVLPVLPGAPGRPPDQYAVHPDLAGATAPTS